MSPFPSPQAARRRDRQYIYRELRARLGRRETLRRLGTDGPQDRLLRRPDAPKANSLVPSVNVIVTNENDEILLIQRSDNGNWAAPGGAIDLGESLSAAAIRETSEETGIICQVTGIVGIYTDPRHVILYTSNGEARQEFSIVLTARAVDGTPTPSSESSRVEWVPREQLAEYPMDRSMSLRLGHYLARRDQPYLG